MSFPAPRPLFLLGAVLCASPLAAAQSFNLDLGNPNGQVPSAAYGAAAAQPGTWNALDDSATGLLDLGGSPTSVDVLFPGQSNINFNELCTSGDDQALMDDVVDRSNGTFVFSGLSNGTYTVYTYAMAPDNPSYVTEVVVLGSADPMQGVGGDFCGGHLLGTTYALHTLTVSDGTISVQISIGTSFSSVNGIQIVREAGSGAPICFGDGSGPVACPCGNPGASGEGCANSTGAGGLLEGVGMPEVGNDSLVLQASGAIPGQPGLFFQGENDIFGGDGTPFGDGLRCCGMNVVRLEVVTPDANGDAATGISISLEGGVGPGDARCYQFWYRDPVGGPCGSTFNLTNAWDVVWL